MSKSKSGEPKSEFNSWVHWVAKPNLTENRKLRIVGIALQGLISALFGMLLSPRHSTPEKVWNKITVYLPVAVGFFNHAMADDLQMQLLMLESDSLLASKDETDQKNGRGFAAIVAFVKQMNTTYSDSILERMPVRRSYFRLSVDEVSKKDETDKPIEVVGTVAGVIMEDAKLACRRLVISACKFREEHVRIGVLALAKAKFVTEGLILTEAEFDRAVRKGNKAREEGIEAQAQKAVAEEAARVAEQARKAIDRQVQHEAKQYAATQAASVPQTEQSTEVSAAPATPAVPAAPRKSTKAVAAPPRPRRTHVPTASGDDSPRLVGSATPDGLQVLDTTTGKMALVEREPANAK